MRLAGYQPQYFPRLHYFARILDADVFEFSDYVQFVKKHTYVAADGTSHRGKSYQADSPIKLSGGVHYLTVPAGQHDNLPINRTAIAATDWPRKHLKSIEQGYRTAPRFATLMPSLTTLLQTPYASLADLNIAATLWALTVILGGAPHLEDISLAAVNERLQQPHPFRLRNIVRISETAIKPAAGQRDATDWIIEMCRAFGADEYIYGGSSATTYMDFDRFEAVGITVVQQAWVCQPYTQQFPQQEFVANVSILDLVLNEDLPRVQQVLLG